MKKRLAAALTALVVLSTMAGCSTAKKPEETKAQLKDGTYTAYFPQPTYLARGQVTIEAGRAVSYDYEECHLPNFWATFTEEEAERYPEEVIPVEGGRGTTYYAKHARIGEGDEAIHLEAQGDGTAMPVYGNKEISDFALWIQQDENAAWYYQQLEEAHYWVELADDTLLEDLGTYSFTRKDGVVLDKTESRMKTKLMHWTAAGTGVGTEMGDLGWAGNLETIGDYLIENQFPEGEISRNKDGEGLIADTVTGATIECFIGYAQMFYDAYNQAK